jgi:hypothetical protein
MNPCLPRWVCGSLHYYILDFDQLVYLSSSYLGRLVPCAHYYYEAPMYYVCIADFPIFLSEFHGGEWCIEIYFYSTYVTCTAEMPSPYCLSAIRSSPTVGPLDYLGT